MAKIRKGKSQKKTINKELIQSGLNMVKSTMSLYLTLSIFYIFLVSGIIYYINNIKNCSCFNELNKNNEVNINYIYILEIILLVLYILIALSLIYSISLLNKIQLGGANKIISVHTLGFIISLFINGYLVYNIYKLSQIKDENCECSKNKFKILLYIQALLIIIMLSVQIFMIIKN
jgi:hypothetical protein